MFWQKRAARETQARASISEASADPTLDAYVTQSLTQMSVAAFILDRAGRVAAWNDACARLTGLAAADVIGGSDHWKGFYLNRRPCLADIALRGEGASGASLYEARGGQDALSGAQKAENWCDLPRGVRVYLEIHAVPLRDAKGETIGVVETLIDLTRLKTMEEELAAAHRETESAVARERELVSQSIGFGLARLAEKDLTFRLTDDLPPAYAQLQDDFNAAVEQLAAAFAGVNDSTDSVHAGSREISLASDDLAQRTAQQAASLEETAAALDEITATVKKTAEGANLAREAMAMTRKDAQHGGEIVRKAVDAMGKIEASSRQISQIIGVIDEIAFQTNLLALNAGVEAARAGDAGRGFAVVASEVRALAQRAADAAKEIKGLISTSTAQVGEGVVLVAETGKALEQIESKVAEITLAVADISHSAQEQALGLQQVNSAVNQMDQATQQNAAMSEQATAASQQLAEETDRLMEMIGEFDVGRAAESRVRRELESVAPHAFAKRRHAPAASTRDPDWARRQKRTPAPVVAAKADNRRQARAVIEEDDWREF